MKKPNPSAHRNSASCDNQEAQTMNGQSVETGLGVFIQVEPTHPEPSQAIAENFDKPPVSQEYLEFISAFPDGKESVEHQLDIYIIDTFSSLSSENKQKTAKLATRMEELKKKYTARKIKLNPIARKKNKTKSKPASYHARSQAGSSRESSTSTSSSSDTSGSSDGSSSSSDSDGNSGMHPKTSGSDIPLIETMQNIQYTLDFRIKKAKIESLDIEIMRRLCDALLLVMKHETGSFTRKRLSDYAESAFFIFGGFIEEISEFRQAVSEKGLSVLRTSLLLDKRDSTESGKSAVVIMIRLVLFCLGEGYDWRDLVDPSKQSGMESYVKKRMAIMDNDKKSLHIQEKKGDLYPPPSLYSDRNIPKLVAMFNVSIEKGLTGDEEVTKRSAYYGANELPKQARKSIFKIILEQLVDFMVLLLITAVIATAIAGEYNSAVVLLVVIVLNTIIGAYEETKASKALDSLKNFSVSTARVFRDGSISEIDSKLLVPGDIIELEEGDSVPADLRVIESSRLSVVETILTGESIPVMKSADEIRTSSTKLALGDCFGNCFMGTLVAKGRGRGIVVRTGSSTEIGKISKAISSNNTSRKTPLQKRLNRLGIWLVVIAISLCAVVVIAGVAWGHRFGPMFLSGLALAVSVIPEGLVAVTTVTMALAVRRAAKKNAIVKRLVAVEVLGSVTCICSDKTGTLTEGRMGVTEIVSPTLEKFETKNATELNPDIGGIVPSSKPNLENESENSNSKPFLHSNKMQPSLLELVKACLLCNNSQVKLEEDGWRGFGDPTEYALLSLALKSKMSLETIKKAETGPDGVVTVYPKRLHENPFDSERKLMTVVIENSKPGKNVEVYAKGAPEQILKICTHKMDNDGTLSKLTNSDLRMILNECAQMAQRGLRVLGLATKVKTIGDFQSMMEAKPTNSSTSAGEKFDFLTKKQKEIEIQEQIAINRIKWTESKLTFVGLVGLTDPPRHGVKEAIKNCQSAGIKVVMITGDHLDTASAIAKQIGILKPGVPGMDRAITGPDLDLLSNDALSSLKPFPNVFARVSPDHKLRIVKTLQKIGHIAAMTGDGVNDAPAVRQADIGIAMGMGGTEITKDASDIVLVDDNFSTIVMAIEEGRRVFDNILKFILYLLSCNTAEIILFLMASVINAELPMPTIMVLWANIIADVPPAMSVGLEPQEKDILKRPPRSPKAGVLSTKTTILLLLQAFYMAVVSFAFYLLALLTPFAATISSLVSKTDLVGQPKLIFGNNNSTNLDLTVPSLQLEIARSLASITIISLQLNQAFLSRSVTRSVFQTGILSNKIMIYAVTLSFGLLLMGMYVPPIAKWLEIVPLNGYAWLLILGAVVVQILYVDMVKILLKRFVTKSEIKRKALESTIALESEPNNLRSEQKLPAILDKQGAKYLDTKAGASTADFSSSNTPNIDFDLGLNMNRKVTTGTSDNQSDDIINIPTPVDAGITPLSHSHSISVSPVLIEADQVEKTEDRNIHDDVILSTPGLTAAETENAYYEKNKVYNWRGDL